MANILINQLLVFHSLKYNGLVSRVTNGFPLNLMNAQTNRLNLITVCFKHCLSLVGCPPMFLLVWYLFSSEMVRFQACIPSVEGQRN